MRIRRAGHNDIHAIDAVLEQLLPGDRVQREAMWPLLLKDPSYTPWVAEDEGTVVGFLDLLIWPDVGHGRKVGLVNNLVVDERARGRRFGTLLLDEAIRYCRRQDVIELHVWTEADNERALGLYKKLGFVDRGRILEIAL